MSNAKKTYTATYQGHTVDFATSRKIAWAGFYILADGSVDTRLVDFYAGSRAHAERTTRSTMAINSRRLGIKACRVVPATVSN